MAVFFLRETCAKRSRRMGAALAETSDFQGSVVSQKLGLGLMDELSVSVPCSCKKFLRLFRGHRSFTEMRRKALKWACEIAAVSLRDQKPLLCMLLSFLKLVF